MNILVFGATGPTGQQIVQQALGRGHRVTAFVRRPEALTRTDGDPRIVSGDVTQDRSKVAEAMVGQELVISALGRGTSFRSDQLMSRSMGVIVPAMAQAGVRRVILMSSYGVGESRRDAPLILGIMFRVLLRDVFADKQSAEEELRGSGLDWTIVHPVLLTNGPLTGEYRAAERLDLHGVPKISRADVAHFIVAEAENRAYVRKVAVISY
jgi:putative NADH-flavin reductase